MYIHDDICMVSRQSSTAILLLGIIPTTLRHPQRKQESPWSIHGSFTVDAHCGQLDQPDRTVAIHRTGTG